MVLEKDISGIFLNGTEQNLFLSKTGLKKYSTAMFFTDMVPNDEMIVRVYILDKFNGVERKYLTDTIQGIDEQFIYFINWINTSQYRVTIQKISGSVLFAPFILYTT